MGRSLTWAPRPQRPVSRYNGKMMRLAWATDVHLNFVSRQQLVAFAKALVADEPDAVLLSGDIAEAPTLREHLLAVEAVVERPVYFVLGNHDFYGGSIAQVRAVARELTATSRWLRWLPEVGAVHLPGGVVLLGHDGWADARAGNFERSPVLLNDYVLIEELRALDRAELRRRLTALGDEAAAYFARMLPQALATSKRVVAAIHVPPFRAACWHEGAISNDDWLPHFTCVAAGVAMAAVMAAHPEAELLVLCGHTHGSGVARIAPNLKVLTGGAKYGAPEPQPSIHW